MFEASTSDGAFQQLLMPVRASLALSFVVAAAPLVSVLVMLGGLRRPAWQASLAGLGVGLVVAVGIWRFPLSLALAAVSNGATFAVWPIMWVVFNALFLYNVAVRSGSFEALKDWLLHHLPNDQRIVLIVIGFSFGALLEGIAGFGTPVAITTAFLILVGFAPLRALTCTLICNTSPVAFAAAGAPITVLAAVTHLPATALAAMVGRQLPVFSLMLPFYVTGVYSGFRSIRALWPVLLVAGGSFAFMQFLSSNFISYALTDVLSSLASLIATLAFLQYWKPTPDPQFAVRRGTIDHKPPAMPLWQACAPWILVSATVIAWTALALFRHGQTKIEWPGLHNKVSITLYKGALYPAVWDFHPLGTGTAILASVIVTSVLFKLRPGELLACAAFTWRQIRTTMITVTAMLGLAYLMNYSGLNYTLGLGVSSMGILFAALAPFLGWIAVALAGTDTAGNALFGNLQVIVANQLKLDPVLFAATNASGGVMGKMISPQNIAIGCSVTENCANEGAVFARTFPHSVILTMALSALVIVQQFLIPWLIPH